MQSRGLAWRLVAPALFFELLIHILPMLTGIAMSFLSINQFNLANWLHAPFVGLANYRIGVSPASPIGSSFLSSIGVTFAFTALVVLCSVGIGLGAALLMNRPFPGRAVVRTIYLIPYAMPVFVTGILWRFMFLREGAVNTLLVDVFHLSDHPLFWLIGSNAFWSIVIVALWRLWPFCFLMFLAGLQAIPTDLYEAVAIDGGGAWAQFRHITLPLMRPVLSITTLVTTLWTFNDFTTPFTLLGSRPPASADLMAVHIYDNAFLHWQFGIGSAMSVMMLVIMLIFTILYNRALRVGSEAA